MRNYGINYDTGITADGDSTRKRFEDAVVRRELQIIATDLHATAVRVTGDDPQRLARAGQHALAAGLELWFSPVPVNLQPGALPGYLARCASEAERLRRAHEGRVVLVAGCEISLWCAGFLPGGDSVAGRIATVTDPDLPRKPDVMAALASGLERATQTTRDIVRAAREKFAGPVTYAAAPWETVGWDLFDLVSVDAYRDADNAAGYQDALHAYRRFGKPVAVTEFGCCTYRGAAGRGGMGWMIVDENADPPVIPGTYERDEHEQVRHLHDMLAIYENEDIDSAFWHTFAGFEYPRHHTDPHRDLDLASYGVVAVLDHGRGTTYPDMAWEPKQVFGALAAAYARARR
jgi:glycosyl hydrolase family 113